jgi:ABC-type amino acid transport system permease subunit
MATNFKALETWGMVAIMYFVIITFLSYAARGLERRLNV